MKKENVKIVLVLFVAMILVLGFSTIQAHASGKIGKTTDTNFNKDVLKQSKYVLVDFWAPWCKPCLMMAPELKKVAVHYDKKLIVMKLNVDENRSMSKKYKIRGIPTLILFKDGKVVRKLVGYRKFNNLKSELDRYIK